MKEICQPKSGETVVITGAAGAVGSHVGQIAKSIGKILKTVTYLLHSTFNNKTMIEDSQSKENTLSSCSVVDSTYVPTYWFFRLPSCWICWDG